MCCLSSLQQRCRRIPYLCPPKSDKRKAIPLEDGVGSGGMTLEAESGWRISDSRIFGRNSLSLWRRQSKDQYYFSNAYAPNEYVVISGHLVPVDAEGGEGTPPWFKLTVPSIDLKWESSCGRASQEDKEDSEPAALLITSDKSKHRRLVVGPATDKGFHGGYVTLQWTEPNCIRVYQQLQGGGERLVTSGTQLQLGAYTYFRIEPIAVSSSKIKFSARGKADDYSGARVVDFVTAFTYDLDIGIKFNHDTSSSANDGINIRPDFNNPYNMPNGEWTSQQGAVAPICYKVNQGVTIKANFSTSSPFLRSARIEAVNADTSSGRIHCLLSFGAQNVTFANGESGDVTYTMSGTAPSSICLSEQESLKWTISNINGDVGVAGTTVTNSGPHKVYVILAEPVSPWVNSTIGNYNAWENALDHVIAWVMGKSCAAEALSSLTSGLYYDNNNHFFLYDSFGGESHYTPYLGGFIFYLSGYLNRQEPLVNCYDQALALKTFGCLLGINDINIIRAEPFGYIQRLNLVGFGLCNNPFYANQYANPSNLPALCDPDNINRSKFDVHAFVNFEGRIFDACTGPVQNDTIGHYLQSTIDTSTEAERAKSLFLPSGAVTNGALSVVWGEYTIQ